MKPPLEAGGPRLLSALGCWAPLCHLLLRFVVFVQREKAESWSAHFWGAERTAAMAWLRAEAEKAASFYRLLQRPLALPKGNSHVSLCQLSEHGALLENVSLHLCPAWLVWFLLVSNCFITVEIDVMLFFMLVSFFFSSPFFSCCFVNICYSYLLQGKREKDCGQKLRNCLCFERAQLIAHSWQQQTQQHHPQL